MLFRSSTSQPFKDHGLSVAHLQGLGILLLSCSSPALEAYLLQVLISEPGCAKLIHIEVLQYCLKNLSHSTQTIGSLLLQNCSTHCLIFELWCLEPANMERLSGQMEDFLPLVNTYLLTVCREDPARLKDGELCFSLSGDADVTTSPALFIFLYSNPRRF